EVDDDTGPIDVAAVRRAVAIDEGLWEPQPVPTPTYLQAPAVQRGTALPAEPHTGVVAIDDEDIELSSVDGLDEEPVAVFRRRAVGDG
ncbi:MAG: hypothetical protein ACR2F6_18155, partial [Mycobacteriales bacterium]